ncbi:glycosyltransferase family 4 protein [Picosynechococcus sp. PCC 11901]|uniref:glycosyltransferase family 4 protein n=1 Tax=Picosynechococcus sp. PCC 11901 TaxID=2579791 RepID=UPI0010FBC1F0|nr:glycosyltransferase family 4 protein [Picosynechococcus sp. PCC 11901]QCS50064.1 glycosyltransferase family 4 protein [Picosynechococcus sp. PCC 11901]
MSNDTPSSENLRVLMMPDYRIDNPYQTLLAKALQTEGVEVVFPFGYRRVLPIFRAINNHPNKIDVLHLHWLSPYIKGENRLNKSIYATKFLIDILLTKLRGVKLVWTGHDYTSHNSKFPGLEQWTQRILLKLSDRVIFHNESALKHFSQTYQLDKFKTEVIPHGHYREFYNSPIDKLEARKALGLPQSGRIYLNLGMLRPYKGIERLLQVWRENKNLLGESTLLIAGQALDPVYGEKIATQVSETEGVILHRDFIEDERIHLFFSAADVVVLPFEKILTSGSIILAMSYGKPIIAPRTGGIVETIGTADWLFYEPEDNQGLLHALKESTQIDLSALSQLVKQECDRLDWEKIGKLTNQIYQITRC